MDPAAAKEKTGAENKDAQEADKDKKTSEDKEPDAACKQLIEFMKGKYDEKVKNVETFDEFYHAFYELIEMYCEHNGQFQYKIPSKEDLRKEYEKVRPPRKRGSYGNMSQKEFEQIAGGIAKLSRFSVGWASIKILALLFGVPVFAVFTKRFIPGLKSVSDDIVIPATTSGVVVYLTKAKKL